MARKKSVSISRKPSASAVSSVAEAPSDGPVLVAVPVESTPVKADTSPGPIGRAVYGAVYCVSYGVVFSAILVGKLVPGSGLIGRALHDGAGAARRSFSP